MRLLLTTFTVAGLGFSNPALAKSARECRAEYTANKQALRDAGVRARDFLAQCRAGAETIPGGGATTAPAVPSPSRDEPSRVEPIEPNAANKSGRSARPRFALSNGHFRQS